MRANGRVDTKPELALRSALHRCGLRFRKDYPIRLPERRVRPDIVLTSRRVPVFVDGCFWHCCPLHGTSPDANTGFWGPKLQRNVERDRAVNVALAAAGWIALRAWEHEPTDEVVTRVATTLQGAVPVPRAATKPSRTGPDQSD
jgi:DNA mismatch endonuclease (patch repair protein)